MCLLFHTMVGQFPKPHAAHFIQDNDSGQYDDRQMETTKIFLVRLRI